MTRQQYNQLILERLEKLIKKYPNLRFGQLLINCDIIETYNNNFNKIVLKDPYNEESKTTFNRMLRNKFAFYEQYN